MLTTLTLTLLHIKTETFNLLNFSNPEDDELLAKYLDENDQILSNQVIQQQPTPDQKHVTTTTTNTEAPLGQITNTYNQSNNYPNFPIVPRMLFQNSSVTINYNFNSK